MKIVTSDQIKEIDQHTMKIEGINSLQLMERAGGRCADWILENIDFSRAKQVDFLVVVFGGNNGGDGLVIARKISENSGRVAVLDYSNEKKTDEFRANFELLPENVKVYSKKKEVEHLLDEHTVVIDALFGIGLNRMIKGELLKFISWLNESRRYIISIDIPSGLQTEDNRENDLEGIVKADLTLSIGFPKWSFLLPSNASFVGKWQLISIDHVVPSSFNQNRIYLTEEIIRSILLPKYQFAHKGTFGHGLLCVGGKGKMGAAVLSSEAALRSGLGLLTCMIPARGELVLQSQVPEAMCILSEEEDFLDGTPEFSKYSSIGIGPGIGLKGDTQRLLKRIIQDYSGKLVIDADGLNILAENKTWLSFLPQNTILTPHLGEFNRLVGKWKSDEECIDKLKELSMKSKAIIILKGAHTKIAFPDGTVAVNSTGNPGMATAGSGDVLTGIITGLLASGYSPSSASLIGVFIHGASGDLALENSSFEGLLARDLIRNLGKVFRKLRE